MSKSTLIVSAIVGLVVLVAFVFFVPVFPDSGPTPIAGHDYSYHTSLSSFVSPYGTSYYEGHYYFVPHYNPYMNDV